MIIVSSVYACIGFLLAVYWFETQYSKEYFEKVSECDTESGMISLILLMYAVIWPVKLIKDFVKKKNSKNS